MLKRFKFNLSRILWLNDVEEYKQKHQKDPGFMIIPEAIPGLRKRICFVIGHDWNRDPAYLDGVRCGMCSKRNRNLDLKEDGSLVRIYHYHG